MRTYAQYGKYRSSYVSRAIGIHASIAILSGEDSGFSDDESETETVDITHETSPEVPKDRDEQHDNIENDPFALLDDLESKPCKKRKFTRLRKDPGAHGSIDEQEETHEFQTTIDSINTIISSLKYSEDVINAYANIVDTDHSERNQCVDQVRYGRTRTLLRRETDENEEEVLEEETEDACFSTLKDSTRNDPNSLIHINQLKTLGEELKFEDDLEFLKFNTGDPEQLISKLISCSLEFLSNTDLIEYIQKYKKDQLWDWCFQLIDQKNIILIYLQLWIANRFPLNRDNSGWLRVSRLLLPASHISIVPRIMNGTKFTKLNYADFTQKAQQIHPQKLALAIWEHYLPLNGKLELNRFLELLEKPNAQLLKILESNISSNLNIGTMKRIYEILQHHIPQFINDTYFIKILVKLTNDAQFLDSISDVQKTSITNAILSQVTKASYEINLERENKNDADNIILQLGLLLNLINQKNTQIDRAIVMNLKTLVINLQHNSFLTRLLRLIFVLTLRLMNVELTQDDIKPIIDSLNELLVEMKDTNSTIYKNTQVGLSILSNL